MTHEPWHDEATEYEREQIRRASERLPADLRQAIDNLNRSARGFSETAAALEAATKRAIHAMQAMFAAIPPEQLREMRRLTRWGR